jgi:prophage regulatory protein
MTKRHLRRPQVEATTGLSRSSIYDMMKKGEFPRPIRIGKRAVAWSESDITDWLANRPTSHGANK